MILVLLLLIPSTRKETMAFLIRSTIVLKKPNIKEHKAIENTVEWNLQGVNTNDTLITDYENLFFINFWATWCAPCIAEMPSIEKLYKDYGQRITFIIVSNEHVNTIQKFIDKNNYNFPIYYSRSIPEYFEHNSLPTTFLVYDNKIMLEKKGAMNWNNKSFKEEISGFIKGD